MLYVLLMLPTGIDELDARLITSLAESPRADRRGLVQLEVGHRLLRDRPVGERPVERHLDDGEGDDARTPLGGEPARDVHSGVRRLAGHDRGLVHELIQIRSRLSVTRQGRRPESRVPGRLVAERRELRCRHRAIGGSGIQLEKRICIRSEALVRIGGELYGRHLTETSRCP